MGPYTSTGFTFSCGAVHAGEQNSVPSCSNGGIAPLPESAQPVLRNALPVMDAGIKPFKRKANFCNDGGHGGDAKPPHKTNEQFPIIREMRGAGATNIPRTPRQAKAT